MKNALPLKLIDIKKDISDIGEIPIGSGTFGTVYRGKFHKKNKIIDCAIKYIDHERYSSEKIYLLHREISSQALIKHPAILPLLGFTMPFCGVGKLTIVTPFMENGSLQMFLDSEKHVNVDINWNDIKRIITVFGVASGLCNMHRKNLIHRNIKPTNILLDKEYHPKICDFKFTKLFEEGHDESYKAPEFLLDDSECNSKVDVFSFGLVVFELFAGESFNDRLERENKTYINAMINGYRPDIANDDKISPFFAKLIKDCWETDPNNRPSFDQIVESLLEAYKKGELIERDDEIDDYIEEAVGCLGFDVSFLE